MKMGASGCDEAAGEVKRNGVCVSKEQLEAEAAAKRAAKQAEDQAKKDCVSKGAHCSWVNNDCKCYSSVEEQIHDKEWLDSETPRAHTEESCKKQGGTWNEERGCTGIDTIDTSKGPRVKF